MDFRKAALFLLTVSFLTACGKVRTASTTLEKSASQECLGAEIPQQFIVKKFDGSTEIVRAESEDAFINGYLTENLAAVDYAEHDYTVHAALPLQAQSAQTTSFADNWGVGKVDADKLWAQNARGEGVVVAVIDTGMDYSHSQLASQVYTNAGEVGTDSSGHNKSTNGIDDEGNGFIDDVHGYDFVGNKPLSGDHAQHGTHVSGIIAAAHSDSVMKSANYVQGIAPKAKIMPLAFLDSSGSGSLSDGVRAIKYAVLMGAQVINASWGGSECSRTLRDSIDALAAKNIAFIAAAGNDGVDVDSQPEYPASLNLLSQITVGAVGDHDSMATYSNYGFKAVHIFAPGSNIVSTLPGGVMGYMTGTSMATPFVSGAVALLKGAMPEATITQIRSALYNSALHDAQYFNASQGRMDLTQALAQLHQIIGH